jgi:hypothetical protein
MIEAKSISSMFMSLDDFHQRLLERRQELPTDTPIDLKKAYENAAERLNIDFSQASQFPQ